MAYDRVSPPFDPWLATGLICSTLANVMGGGGKNKKMFKPEDFMPGRKPPRPQTVEEMMEKAMRITDQFNGRGPLA